MKVVKKNEGTPYEALKHFNVWSTHKISADKESQRLTVSVSHFLPNGGVEMSGGPTEKIYYILRGSMVVTTKTEEYILEEGDTAYFSPNEERAIRIPNNDICSILVCLAKI